ncbi:MAG: hypothetical protein CVU59_07325 [Deltaproteobacteria bacterium HGW-Deltaproteobacteria-17]|nr:MAG: hypothetical protein CVU59_07325 [Deltaproteobacteria bacterium HGW-Deltaproteobacteria-17]
MRQIHLLLILLVLWTAVSCDEERKLDPYRHWQYAISCNHISGCAFECGCACNDDGEPCLCDEPPVPSDPSICPYPTDCRVDGRYRELCDAEGMVCDGDDGICAPAAVECADDASCGLMGTCDMERGKCVEQCGCAAYMTGCELPQQTTCDTDDDCAPSQQCNPNDGQCWSRHCLADQPAAGVCGPESVCEAAGLPAFCTAREGVFTLDNCVISRPCITRLECTDPLKPLCSDDQFCVADPAPGRPFLMGFSPWPWDATLAAVDWTYEHIKEGGDVLSEHLEEGVPWPEALAGTAFSASYTDELNSRLQRLDGHATVLQINAMNISRDGLAPYRGSDLSMPLPGEWGTYRFNDDNVKTAYLNYARRMIDVFSPAYVLIGVEVNLLLRNNPSLWPDWVELNAFVYAQLKLEFPELPVGVSVFCVPYFDQWSGEDDTAAQLAALHADLEPSADFIAFSLHPFMSGLLADSFPVDYLWDLFAMTTKPVAVSESSYPAQPWQLTSPALTFDGTPEKQDRFLHLMLEASRDFNAAFVIWFTIRDYDQLWQNALGAGDDTLIWRDTGLYDENGTARPAYTRWSTWLGYDLGK